MEWIFIDGSHVRAHQHSAGIKYQQKKQKRTFQENQIHCQIMKIWIGIYIKSDI